MRTVSLFEAAKMLNCSVFWIETLLKKEYLCSLQRRELETFLEKAPAMFDVDLGYEMRLLFLHA